MWTKFFGKVGKKASANSLAVTIASQKRYFIRHRFFLSYSRLLTGKTSSEYLYTDTYMHVVNKLVFFAQ